MKDTILNQERYVIFLSLGTTSSKKPKSDRNGLHVNTHRLTESDVLFAVTLSSVPVPKIYLPLNVTFCSANTTYIRI